VFQLFITGKYEYAIKYIVQYKLCNLEEFKTKKAVAVIDKIAKFIKLSRYYDRWAEFKETVKNDKSFDKKIQDLVLAHNDGIKMSKMKTKAIGNQVAVVAKPAVVKPTIKVVPKKPTLVPVAKTIIEQENLVNTRKTVIVKKKL
jgi:hypothetical protein